ncbi:hypothetical protein GJ496_011747 [Pomphorhynchus laevis]|nr:hypothetical protein GJ496_011747 [Pomphorhynchus laevis]
MHCLATPHNTAANTYVSIQATKRFYFSDNNGSQIAYLKNLNNFSSGELSSFWVNKLYNVFATNWNYININLIRSITFCQCLPADIHHWIRYCLWRSCICFQTISSLKSENNKAILLDRCAYNFNKNDNIFSDDDKMSIRFFTTVYPDEDELIILNNIIRPIRYLYASHVKLDVFVKLILYFHPDLLSKYYDFMKLLIQSWQSEFFYSRFNDHIYWVQFWDHYLQRSDDTFVYFLLLVFVKNCDIMGLTHYYADFKIKSQQDIEHWIYISEIYQASTPVNMQSYHQIMDTVMVMDTTIITKKINSTEQNFSRSSYHVQSDVQTFNANRIVSEYNDSRFPVICINQDDYKRRSCQFFSVFCHRSDECRLDYIHEAFHVDINQVFTEPETFKNIVTALLAEQEKHSNIFKQANRIRQCCHICLISNINNKDSVITLALLLLKRCLKFVSILMIDNFDKTNTIVQDSRNNPGTIRQYGTNSVVKESKQCFYAFRIFENYNLNYKGLVVITVDRQLCFFHDSSYFIYQNNTPTDSISFMYSMLSLKTITSNCNQPELLTFNFINDVVKLFVPKASELVQAIKQIVIAYIVKQ